MIKEAKKELPKNVKCIIFDFDGVIADTDSARYNLLAEILSKYKIDLYTIPKQELVGLSTRTFLKQHFNNLSDEDILNITSHRHKLYMDSLEDYCNIYPGAKETIKELSKYYDLILATTNKKNLIELILEHFDLKNLFLKIYGKEIIENTLDEKTYKQKPNNNK